MADESPTDPAQVGEEKKEEAVAAPPAAPSKPVAPVLKVDLDTDPAESVAFTLLEDWAKRVPEDELESYRLLYTRLWEAVKIAFENEKTMLKKARQLNNDVLGEKINMEKARMRQTDEQENVERLEREREGEIVYVWWGCGGARMKEEGMLVVTVSRLPQRLQLLAHA